MKIGFQGREPGRRAGRVKGITGMPRSSDGPRDCSAEVALRGKLVLRDM